MKIRQRWLVVGLTLITVGWICTSACFAQDSADQDSWNNSSDNDRQSPPDRDRPMRPGGRGMGPGSGRGMGPGSEGGLGMGPGGGGPGRGSGGGRWGAMVDEDELLMFLNKHESRLATRLEELQKTSPQEYREQLSTLSRLYGPVIRQMEMSPAMGQLSLEKIRLSLKIKEQVQEAKSEGADLTKIKETLKVNVTKQFDVIVDQEKFRIKYARERLESWSSRAPEDQAESADQESPERSEEDRRGRRGRDRDRPGDRGMGRGPGPGPADPGGPRRGGPEGRGRGRGWGQAERIEQFSKHLEQKNKTIESWLKNKENIVNKRIEILLEDHEEFPW